VGLWVKHALNRLRLRGNVTSAACLSRSLKAFYLLWPIARLFVIKSTMEQRRRAVTDGMEPGKSKESGALSRHFLVLVLVYYYDEIVVCRLLPFRGKLWRKCWKRNCNWESALVESRAKSKHVKEEALLGLWSKKDWSGREQDSRSRPRPYQLAKTVANWQSTGTSQAQQSRQVITIWIFFRVNLLLATALYLATRQTANLRVLQRLIIVVVAVCFRWLRESRSSISRHCCLVNFTAKVQWNN